MVALSTVNTEGGKISCETPEGTVINININQRSFLDCMLDAIKTVKVVKKANGESKPARQTGSGIALGVGASFITLGCICVTLSTILAVTFPSLTIAYAGVHFWLGFPFMACGLLNVVTYKYPSALWGTFSFVSLMGSLAVSITGMVFSADDISNFGWRNDLVPKCKSVLESVNQYRNYDRYDRYYYGYRTTEPPRYYPTSTNWNLQDCERGFEQYQKFLYGIVILSLLITIWGVCLSAVTLGYRLKEMVYACKCQKAEGENEDKDEPMLPPNPVGDVFVA
ncbi:transmembrane protein 176B-like [Hyperolius riggenbachi]|uniref:transmembrane protein 176B-like n=1 Tax=Hyperolius riggenbachi TaxID=752182 RepID=UPI0035A37726